MLTSRSPVFLDLSSLFYCALTRSCTPSPLAQPNVSKPQGGRQPGSYPVLLQLDSASASLRIKSGQWNRLGSFWGKSLRKMGFVWGGRVAERAREIPFIQVFFTFTFRYLREPPEVRVPTWSHDDDEAGHHHAIASHFRPAGRLDAYSVVSKPFVRWAPVSAAVAGSIGLGTRSLVF